MKNTIGSLQVDCPDSIEQICVKLSFQHKNMYIFGSYIPPASSEPTYQQHVSTISSIAVSANELDIVISAGDFNLPGLDFVADSEWMLPLNVKRVSEVSLIDSLMCCDINQLNSLYTEQSRSFFGSCFL